MIEVLPPAQKNTLFSLPLSPPATNGSAEAAGKPLPENLMLQEQYRHAYFEGRRIIDFRRLAQ
jgi:hypothetical protein